jgi:hypothetical protein|tara:strand:- start:476 stop:829 length:354 start_codon:yes stop_codon:yes gene_type:complete
MQEQKIKLDIAAWKINIEQRRRNRMKFTVKMGKDESEAFKNFMEQLRPDDVSEDNFIRTIFYKGVEKFQEELMENMKSYLEDNKDNIDASAIEALGSDASALMGAMPDESSPIEVIE